MGDEPVEQRRPPPGGFGAAPSTLGNAPRTDEHLRTKAALPAPLVAIMVAIAVLAILAVLAIVGFRKRLEAVRGAEAMNSLGEIATAAIAQREQSGADDFCSSATAPVPTFVPLRSRTGYTADPSPGRDYHADTDRKAGFACIGWEMKYPQHFQYDYSSTAHTAAIGATFTGIARGDANGDSDTFKVGGIANGKETKITGPQAAMR